MSVVATRRSERRSATVAEIKDAAWADMHASGSLDCSLRAVARELGMAPSALYRYFASRDELLTALIIDAFDDLSATLAAAYERAKSETPEDQPGEVFASVAGRYRRWALADTLRYRLVFGSPIGGYVGTEATTAASQRASQVMLDMLGDLVDADALDLERLADRLTPGAERHLEQWAATLPRSLPAVALAVALDTYAALHGAIQLEVNGHLPPPVVGDEEIYLATMRQSLAAALR